MRNAYAAGALMLIAGLTACGRDDAGAGSKAPNIGAQMERQTEKTVAAFDDATITAKIKTALIADPNLKGLSIDVDTVQNVVSLTGTVVSEDAKKQAEAIARKVDGVKGVNNNLTVKPAA